MKTISLSEIADLESGSGFPVDYQGETSGDLAFAKVSDISNAVRSGSRYIKSAKNYISRQKARELKAKVFPPGTIVFAKIGEAIKGNMRAMTTCEMLFDNNVMGVSSTSKGVDHIFLFHFLNTLDFYSLANKTSVPALRKSDLQRIQIPFPPIAEQKRIAAILDKAEALRSLRRQALGELDALTQSIFLEMFGNPVTNSKGWECVRFSDLLSAIESGRSPNCLDRPVEGEEWGVLKLGAVTWCEYNSLENKALPLDEKPDLSLEVKSGDLLFTRKNTFELVAACALVRSTPPHLLLPDLIFRFRVKPNAPIDLCFLHQLLINPMKRREIQKLASGSASSMPNISKTKLQETLIEVPPLSLQQEFARRVEAIEQLKATHRESLAHLDALFASLQHRAFRGEL